MGGRGEGEDSSEGNKWEGEVRGKIVVGGWYVGTEGEVRR